VSLTIDEHPLPPAEPPARRPRGIAAEAAVIAVMLVSGAFVGYLLGVGVQAPDPYATQDFTFDRPAAIPLRTAYYNGTEIHYYDFGETSAAAAPMVLLFSAENHSQIIEGQWPIIDTIPGHPGYSDFWIISKAYVPSPYVANSIRSFQEVYVAGYEIEPKGWSTNWPVVNEDTTLENSTQEVDQWWYRGSEVDGFDMGRNVPLLAGAVVAAPVYLFVYGNGSMVPGQLKVFPSVPGDDGYTDLWRLHQVVVPDSYSPGSYRDATSVLAAAEAGDVQLVETDTFVNCPVVD